MGTLRYVAVFIFYLSATTVTASGPAEKTHEPAKELPGILEEIIPSYGPKAGGTLVTMVGSNLIDQSGNETVKVVLSGTGGNIYPCSIVDRSKSDRTVVTTPSFSGTEEVLDLTLEVRKPDGSVRHSLSAKFNYRPDPTLTTIYPNSTIPAGGVTVNLLGHNLNAAMRPELTGSVVRRGVVVKNLPNQQAYFVNDTVAKFHTPSLGDAILDGSPLNDVTLLIGFLFDGAQYPTFTNVPLESNPVVEQWPETLNYSSDADSQISIHVTWPPNDHISMDDVSVMVGARRCLNTRRNNSQLQCEPPSVPDSVILNGPETMSKPKITVHIGNLEVYVGSMIYSLPGGIHSIIIVMSAILAAIFLISMVFGCIACCSSRREKRKPNNNDRSAVSYVPVDDQDENARRRSRNPNNNDRSAVSYVPLDDQDENARRRSRVRLSKDSIVDIPQQYQRRRSNSSISSTSSKAGLAAADQQLQVIKEQGEPRNSKVVFTDMSK